jgi:hypothetical protein
MSIGTGKGQRGIGDDDGGLAAAVGTGMGAPDVIPEPEYTSAVDFAWYVGLGLVVVVLAVGMLVVEVAAEVKRLWNGEGTLWR